MTQMKMISLRTLVGAIGTIVAAMVAVSMPLGYFVVDYSNTASLYAFKADLNARSLAAYIYTHDTLWQYQRVRLAELLNHANDDKYSRKRVVDSAEKLVFEDGSELASPVLTRSAPIEVAGSTVGRIEISTSLRPLVYETGFVAILSILLGLGIFFVVRVFPLRVLDQTLGTLKSTNDRFDAALNNMSQGLCMFDSAERLVVSNDRYIDMYDLSRDIVKPGCTLTELIKHRAERGHPIRDPDQYRTNLLADLKSGNTINSIVETGDGREIAITNCPMQNGGWVATHSDITETTRAAKELQSTKTFLDTVVENVPATLVVKNARDHRYILINRAGEQLFGLPREQMIGKTAHDFFPKDDADTMAVRDDEVLRSGQQLLIENNEVQTPDGTQRLVTTKRLAIHDDAGEPQYLLSVIEDVTERRRAAERIAHLAHHDSLTDLPNRAAFTERLAATLDQATKATESFAVLCIDLDRFKEVNDVFGHTAGDALLREVSRRLRQAAEGAFLARLGGDEFTVIAADGPQPSTAEALADRLLATLADDLDIEGNRLRVGLSIGVAIFPSDGADAMTLVSNADAALYRAKSDGRGTIRFFEPDMDKRLRDRRALQHDLRSAVAHGELTLHYQPQARIGGEIIGFEALVRWHHPSRGVIPPGTFIPLAEASGLILPIGEWILREACREAASWPKPMQIAINLSPIQFRHGDLPALVHSVLLETGLGAGRLELEITEGVLIDDFSRALSILRRLKALGVHIAMDDFGTGYSSLSYLQSFPFDKIKIDQSFIANLDRNPQAAAIIRAVIGLGHGLDLPVVAEGVETSEQLAFLSHEACNEVQGYLIGKPLAIENYDEIVGRRREASPQVLRLVS